MTEQRKIQLATEVDASGAAQGFDRIKAGAREMAQVVTQAGQTAGKGLDSVGEGAKRAADGMNREESRMRSSIQRTTLDLQTLGKTASERLEAKISLQGLDAAKFAPYLAQLREVEQAQAATARGAAEAAAAIKAAQTTSASRSAFLDSLKQQSDSIGKTRAELLALRAAELGVAEAAGPMIAKLAEADRTAKGFAGNGKLNAFQQQQIGFQLHDFAVQVASGQSPITALVQQGSQLSGTFGGAGNAIKAVTSLITPMKLAVGGAAVAVGALALAMAHAESSARDLASVQSQLSGTGRSDLFSTKELKDFLAELALAPGVTRETATAIVSELAKFHDIGGALFKDLGRLAVDYAAATGQKVPEATRELARAFAEPEKGAKALDQALGALSSSQLLQIERLTRMGDIAGAQRIMFDALQQSISGLAQRGLTPLQQSTNELGNSWERLQRAFGESEGLRSLLGLLAKTIDGVTWLVNNAPKLGGLPTLVKSITPGGQAAAVASAAVGGIKSLLGLDTPTAEDKARAVAGPVADATGAKNANTAATVAGNKAQDEETKRTLEATKGYRSQAQQISDLVKDRERLNKVIKESKDPDVVKEARGRLVGVNERIASLQKKGQGGGGNEAQQVLDAQLQGSIKAAQDAMQQEKDAIAFSQRYLQGVYQAGQTSLKDFYEAKRQAIESGTQSEIAALEKERASVEAHIEKTKRTSPKDTSKIQEDQNRLGQIDRQVEKLRLAAQRETILATQEETEATRQLSEQVQSYRANLLQLQGDEAGAAKIRAQVAIQQASILAKQSQGTKNPITAADEKANADAIQQTNDIAAARTRLGVVTQSLALAEQRIAMLQQTGQIGELEALQQIGAARSAKLASMEREVALLEQQSRARPLDVQLQLDTSRARLELDSLKAQLDPLKEKFDSIFKDATSNVLNDLITGKFAAVDSGKMDSKLNQIEADYKRARDRISGDVRLTVEARDKALADLDKKRSADEKKTRQDAKPDVLDQVKAAGAAFGKQVSTQITGILTKEFANSLISGNGGIGGFFADLFGGDKRKTALQASIDTSGVSQSLSAMRSTGIDPATDALTRLQQAADAAAQALPGADVSPVKLPGDNPGLPLAPLPDGTGAAGDFARFDRAYAKAVDATTEGAKADLNAAGAVTKLAAAAAQGGSALGSLPQIISAISAAAGGGGNPGALIGKGLGAIFGGGSTAAVSNTAFGSTTFADALADGLIPLSAGGYTGDVDVRQAAGVVHGKEFVFSAPATAAIGREKLERAHELAKAGDGNALASIVTNNLFATGKPGYMAGGFVGGTGQAPSRPELTLSLSSVLGGLGWPASTSPASLMPAPTDRAPSAAAAGFSLQPALQALASLRISPAMIATGLATMASARPAQVAGSADAAPAAAPVFGDGLAGIIQRAFALVRQPGAALQAAQPVVPGIDRLLSDVLPRITGERTASLIPLSTGGYTGDVDPRTVAGVVHGKEYVFSAEATAAIGVGRLERLHRMAKTGQVEGRGVRGYSDGGYVTIPGDRLQTLGSVQYLVPPQQPPAQASETHVTHQPISVTVNAPPGMTRQTAMQRGAEAGQEVATALRRQGKRR